MKNTRLFKTKKLSIFYRLLISSIAFAIFIITTLTGVFYFFSKDSINKYLKEEIYQDLNNIAYDFNSIKEKLVFDHEILATDPSVDNYVMSPKFNYDINSRELEKLFFEYLRHSNTYQSIYYVDYLGMEKIRVDKSTGRIRQYRDLSESSLFKKIIFDTPAVTAVEAPQVNKNGDVQFFSAVNVIDGDVGQFGGGIIIKHDLNKYLDFLNEIKINDVKVVWVFSPDGRTLMYPSDETYILDPGTQLLKEFQKAPVFLESDDGMILYQDLSLISGEPFVRVAISVPSIIILSDIKRMVRFSFIVFLIFSVIIVIRVYYQSKHFSEPIVELSKAAASLAKGNLTTVVNLKAHGEVSTLVDSFNQMSSELKLSREEIIERSEELDAANEILESTNEELAASNEELMATNEELSASNEELDDLNATLDQRVKERTKNLREAQRIAKLGNCIWNIATGEVECSEEAYRILGLPTNTTHLTIDMYSEIIHPDDRERFIASTKKTPTSTGEAVALEYRVLLPNAEVRELINIGVMMFDDNGNQLYVTGTIQDITDRKKIEKEKEALWSQLLQAQKMESIGRLTGKIAHDFNNLLTPIIGFSSLAMENLPDGDNTKKILAKIHNAGNKAAALISQLLSFSKKQVLKLNVVNINKIIESMSDILSGIVGESGVLELKLDPSIKNITGDSTQIEQVLMNLVVNSKHAIPEGGRVFIETVYIELDEKNAKNFQGATPGEYVKLIVADNGVGMDTETMQKMFDPFFTTRAKGKGTGLGLSTVFGIIQQHDGFLHVSSTPDYGSIFEVYFPATDGDIESVKVEKIDIKEDGEGTILVVDDDVENLDLYVSLIAPLGYNVLKADSGEQALKTIQNSNVNIDLLVTDVVMPGMNGWRLYDTVKKSKPNIKVMFISGFVDNQIVMENILENKKPFLKKPFPPKNFLDMIRELLHK